MNRIVLLAVTLLLGVAGRAQAQSADVLYLKNGSVIRGQILEFVAGGTVRIETADGSVFVFEAAQVEKMTKSTNGGTLRQSGGKSVNGFRVIAGTGIMANDYGDCILSEADIALGGRMAGGHLFVGGGVGINSYLYSDDITDNENNLIAFGVVRYNVLSRLASPFVEARPGYASGDLEGFYFGADVGCFFRLGRRLGLAASMCFVSQTFEDDYGYFVLSETTNSVGFKVGLEF